MLKRFAIALVVLLAVVAGIPAMQQLIGQTLTPAKPTQKAATTLRAPTLAQPSGPGTVRVELSEQEVNQFLKDGLTQRGYQVDDLEVRLEDGRFVASTSQQVAFFRVPITIIGTAAVEQGQVVVQLNSVTAAGANVPQDIVDQVVANFRTQLAADMDSLHVTPISVQLRPGRLIVEGTRK